VLEERRSADRPVLGSDHLTSASPPFGKAQAHGAIIKAGEDTQCASRRPANALDGINQGFFGTQGALE
jgi:hypothetical protein